jgi:enoyl-CoA hydratase/carnithine racemase
MNDLLKPTTQDLSNNLLFNKTVLRRPQAASLKLPAIWESMQEDDMFGESGINVGLFCSTPVAALNRNNECKWYMHMLLTSDFIDTATALQCGLS